MANVERFGQRHAIDVRSLSPRALFAIRWFPFLAFAASALISGAFAMVGVPWRTAVVVFLVFGALQTVAFYLPLGRRSQR